MLSSMVHQVLSPSKGFWAVVATMRSLSCVPHHMVLIVVFAGEVLSASLTSKWSFIELLLYRLQPSRSSDPSTDE